MEGLCLTLHPSFDYKLTIFNHGIESIISTMSGKHIDFILKSFFKKIIITCVYVCMLMHMCAWWIFIDTCSTANVWRSEENFVKPVLSLPLYVGPRDWTCAAKLAWRVLLPSNEPFLWPDVEKNSKALLWTDNLEKGLSRIYLLVGGKERPAPFPVWPFRDDSQAEALRHGKQTADIRTLDAITSFKPQ